MYIIKTLLRYIFISFLCLFLLVSALLSLVILYPQLTFQVVEKVAFPDDLNIKWEKAHFSMKSRTAWIYEIDWTLEGVKISKNFPSLVLPIDKFNLSADLNLSKQIVQINKFDLIALSLISFTPPPKTKNTSEQNIYDLFHQYLIDIEKIQRFIQLKNLNLQISQFDTPQLDSKILSVGARAEMTFPSQDIRFSARVSKDGNQSGFQSKISGIVNLQNMNSEKNTFSFDINFNGLNYLISQKVTGTYNFNRIHIDSTGPIEYTKDDHNIKINPTIDISLKPQTLQLNMMTDITGLPFKVKHLENLKIKMSSPLEEDIFLSSKPTDVLFETNLSLDFIDQTLINRLQAACSCQLQKSVTVHGKGQTWLENLNKNKLLFTSEIKFENLKNKLFSLDVGGNIKLDRTVKGLGLESELNTRIDLFDLQKMKSVLDLYKMALPPHLGQLQGSVTLKSNGAVNESAKDFNFPMQIDFDLKNQKERLKLTAETQIRLQKDLKSAEANIVAKIEDLQIEWPYINPVGTKEKPNQNTIPQKNAEDIFNLNLDLQVETKRAGSIKFVAPFFSPAIPLTFILKTKSENSYDGFFQVEPFESLYFGKKIKIEKVRVDLGQIQDAIIPSEGRFKIQQTHYIIFVDFNGTASSPRITLTSNPELPELDIVAQLLFDRGLESLSPAETESARSLQNALSDRSLGLFGLWSVISMPVKKFYYDTLMKDYRINHTSGSEVTTTSETQFFTEFRKKLSKNWQPSIRWTKPMNKGSANPDVSFQWTQKF